MDWEHVWNIVKNKKNVIGINKDIVPKQIDNKETVTDSIRIYVKTKVSEEKLNTKDIVPRIIHGTKTDIIEIGEVKKERLMDSEISPIDIDGGRKGRVRPLQAGISFGNIDITAGTLGWFYKYRGDVYIGTNAHIGCSDPLDDKQDKTVELQPAEYDGGNLNDVIGKYYWHERIEPGSNCWLANLYTKFGNCVSKLFGRESRFKTSLREYNKIDFCLTTIEETFKPDVYDLDKEVQSLGGHLFAGSEQVSIYCKITNILEAIDVTPLKVPYKDFKKGDKVIKSGRTTGVTTGIVESESARIRVRGYGNKTVTFDDVVITSDMSDGGDSGSAGFIL